MKTKLLTILLSLALSFCLKANLNNIADPSKGSGIFYAYSLVPMALTGSQEVIPVALATNVVNLPTSIDNGTTVNNIEVKFNKDIEADSTITIRSTDPILKVNGLNEVTLTFTVANARSPQIVSLSASSESLADVGVILEFESPLVPKTQKVIVVKSTGNQQAVIVKNSQNVALESGQVLLNNLPGDQITYNVTLKYQPIENTTIFVQFSSYRALTNVDKNELVFTPQNYNIPQSIVVTLSPISTSYPTENISVYENLTFKATANSSNSLFSITLKTEVFTSIIVSGTSSLSKGGNTNLQVSLSHKPDSDRTVAISLSSSKFLSLNKTSLVFTPSNYNVPQNLQVTASSQNYIFGSVTATFTTSGYRKFQLPITINDPDASYLDVMGGDGDRAGYSPTIAIDSVNSKLLIARTQIPVSGMNFSLLKLSICNLDGTNCITKNISELAGVGAGSGNLPSIAIDSVNSKILITTQNYANNINRPSLFICNLTATSCSHVDISAGRGSSSGEAPKLLVDSVNNKVLVITRNSETGFTNRLSLFRCDLNGTNCNFTDISAGMGNESVRYATKISAGIDYTNSKLLVVTKNNFTSNNFRPSFFRCDLDGANCTYAEISAGESLNYTHNPSLAIDSVNGNLYITANRYNGETTKPIVYKCNLSGSACSFTNLATTYDSNGNEFNYIAIDQANSKVLILVSTYDPVANSDYYPGIYRCNLDMTGCTYNSLALTGGYIMRGGSNDFIIDTHSPIPRILAIVNTGTDYTQTTKLIRVILNYID